MNRFARPGRRAAGPLTALALAVGIALAAAPARSQPAEERRTHRLTDRFLESFNADFSAGRLRPWMALWAENAVRRSTAGEQVGRARIAAFYEGLHGRVEGIQLQNERQRVVQGARVAWEGETAGLHRASGARIRLPIVIFLEFDEAGLVQQAHFHLDRALLAQQVQGGGPE